MRLIPSCCPNTCDSDPGRQQEPSAKYTRKKVVSELSCNPKCLVHPVASQEGGNKDVLRVQFLQPKMTRQVVAGLMELECQRQEESFMFPGARQVRSSIPKHMLQSRMSKTQLHIVACATYVHTCVEILPPVDAGKSS